MQNRTLYRLCRTELCIDYAEWNFVVVFLVILYRRVLPQDCVTACDGCTGFMEDYRNRNTQVNGTRVRRSAGVQQLSDADKLRLKNGTSLEDVKAASVVKRMPACGMQLYTCEDRFCFCCCELLLLSSSLLLLLSSSLLVLLVLV